VLGGLLGERAFPGIVYCVKYEDVLSQPLAELRLLCRHLGVIYSDEMLGARSFSGVPYTASQHKLVDGKIDETRRDEWKWSLTRLDIALFESETADILPCLGYELLFGKPIGVSKFRRWLYLFVDVAFAVRSRILRSIKFRVHSVK